MPTLNNRTTARPDYNLNLSSPLFEALPTATGGQSSRTPIETLAQRLDVSIAWDGSNYLKFFIDDTVLTARDMADIFDPISGWIGWDMIMSAGGKNIWRGYLYEMIFSAGGHAERINMQDMANEVVVDYSGGTTPIITSPTGSAQSAAIFGRKQLKLPNDLVNADIDTSAWSLADATRFGTYYVENYAFPVASPYAGDDRTTLKFWFIGYLQMLDWLPVEITPGMLPISVKDALEFVITTAGQGVITFTADSIQDNGQVWTTAQTKTGLEFINDLTSMLATDGSLWVFKLGVDNVFRWGPLDTTPTYTKRQGRTPIQNGIFTGFSDSKPVRKWDAEAGVVLRNLIYPISNKRPNSRLQQARDSIVQEIRYNETGEPSFQTLKEDATAITYGYSEEYKDR